MLIPRCLSSSAVFAAIGLVLVLAGCGAHHRKGASLRITGEGGIGPALSIADVRSARADVDPNSGQPIVALDLTKDGSAKLTQMTRELARAGARHHRPFHVSIVVNGRLLFRPYIDYHLFPHGLDGSAGIVIDGVRSKRTADALAAELNRR